MINIGMLHTSSSLYLNLCYLSLSVIAITGWFKGINTFIKWIGKQRYITIKFKRFITLEEAAYLISITNQKNINSKQWDSFISNIPHYRLDIFNDIKEEVLKHSFSDETRQLIYFILKAAINKKIVLFGKKHIIQYNLMPIPYYSIKIFNHNYTILYNGCTEQKIINFHSVHLKKKHFIEWMKTTNWQNETAYPIMNEEDQTRHNKIIKQIKLNIKKEEKK